ncbi:MAG: signal peptidase II [Firmicutes bacterium]|nr:signal peptidase II [Bacillota bacterium]MDH7496443.1 signal peptidase II [Bacillota bacterium]
MGARTRPWLIAAAVIAVDQGTKILVERSMPGGGAIALLGGAAHIVHVRNAGSAFGIFRTATIPMLVSALVVTWWLVANLTGTMRGSGRVFETGSSVMVGGALGNLIDRVRAGCVVDFVDFHFWPVFNLADTAIAVGALLVVYAMVLGKTRGRSSE